MTTEKPDDPLSLPSYPFRYVELLILGENGTTDRILFAPAFSAVSFTVVLLLFGTDVLPFHKFYLFFISFSDILVLLSCCCESL